MRWRRKGHSGVHKGSCLRRSGEKLWVCGCDRVQVGEMEEASGVGVGERVRQALTGGVGLFAESLSKGLAQSSPPCPTQPPLPREARTQNPEEKLSCHRPGLALGSYSLQGAQQSLPERSMSSVVSFIISLGYGQAKNLVEFPTLQSRKPAPISHLSPKDHRIWTLLEREPASTHLLWSAMGC